MARLDFLRIAPWVAAAALSGCFDGSDPGQSASTTKATTSSTTGGTTTTADSSTTGDASTTTSTTEMTTTTGELGKPHAFLITAMTVADPHFYYVLVEGGECSDATSLVNSWLASELEDGDVNQAVVLFPADVTDGAQAPMLFTNAKCNGGQDTCSQLVDEGDLPIMSVATNVDSGVCSVRVNGTWNLDYDESPNVPSKPCFSSEVAPGSVRIAGGETLPAIQLSDVRIAASYTVSESGKATNLVEGTIRGFLSQSAAEEVEGIVAGVDLPFNIWGTTAGGGGCQPNPDDPVIDVDANPDVDDPEAGVWLYLNFEARKVEWL